MPTIFPIVDDVVVNCPTCGKQDLARRVIYPDAAYYTTRHGHKFTILINTADLSGRRQNTPAKGYNDDEAD